MKSNDIFLDYDIAIIGGSGLYSIADSVTKHDIETPYGSPSAPISIAKINDKKVVFLPRHGESHEFPPHKINYLANIWALKSLGVKKILSVGAVGCLRSDWNIGDIVVCDQFVNRTRNRIDTYFNGPITTHISVSDPYCPELSNCILNAGKELNIKIINGAVLVIIEGPRYSTRAENRDWQRSGYDLISMTHYPEIVLAREINMCYSSVCLITDYACVLDDPKMPTLKIGHMDVVEKYSENKERLLKLLSHTISQIPSISSCECSESLARASSENADKIPGTEIMLRHGHNPTQKAFWNTSNQVKYPVLINSKIDDPNGKKLSLTDLQNIDTAIKTLKYQPDPSVVLVKHALITGAAHGFRPNKELFEEAVFADKAGIRTGTAVFNRKLDLNTAKQIVNHPFDLIVATDFDSEAKEFLLDAINSKSATHENLRLVTIEGMDSLPRYTGDTSEHHEIHSFNDGSFVKSLPYLSRIRSIEDLILEGIFSPKKLTLSEKEDLLFAWYITIASRTNSAVIVNENHVLSLSAGNQDGLSAIEHAIYKYKSRYKGKASLRNSILATDGNFPFESPIKMLVSEGIKTILLPGKAKNDAELIKECDESEINIVFTGERCFLQ